MDEGGQDAGILANYSNTRFYLLDVCNNTFRVCNFSGSWNAARVITDSFTFNVFTTVVATIKPNLITLKVGNKTQKQLSYAEGTTTISSFGLYTRMTNNGRPSSYSKVLIKWMKIYKDNVLVRDYIPVRVGLVGYMYDKVSGELFGNEGTGKFILGPDI